MEEIHDFCQRLLGLVLTGHILEGDAGFLLDVHLGIGLAHTHDSAAAHTLHGEVHKEQQEQEWDSVIQQDQKKGAAVALLTVGNHVIIQNPVDEIIIPFQSHHIIIQILGILSITLLRDDRDFRAAHLDGVHLSGFHHLDELIIGQLLTFLGIQIVVHTADHDKCKYGSNHQHGYGLPVTFHIRVLFVIIIHIVQILPLNGSSINFQQKPILYHYSVSLPINQEKNN